MKIFLDRFTSLDDLSKKERRDPLQVLPVLGEAGRFSTFDVDDDLAHSLAILRKNKWLEYTGGEYPWHEVRITDAGRKVLKE